MPTLSEIEHARREQGYVALTREWLERLIQKEPQNFEALLIYLYHLMELSLFKEADRVIALTEPLVTSSLMRRIFLETKADRLNAAGELHSAIELYQESHLIDPSRSLASDLHWRIPTDSGKPG